MIAMICVGSISRSICSECCLFHFRLDVCILWSFDYVQVDHADIRPIARRTADALGLSNRQTSAEADLEAAGAGAPSPGGASDRSSLVVDLDAD